MILRRLLCTLQLLVASQRVLRSFAFSPIVPPRFDNFCEQVIGAWGISSNSETKYVGDVEEVMRSCGGAVQGIREVPQIVDSSSSAAATQDHHRLYHNRADDGFIYFDCGSYSQGPVNSPDPVGTQVGCLTFSTMPKSRILFDSSGTWQTLVRGPKSQMMLSDENACLQPTHGDDDAESVGLDASVAWGKDIVCRMPNNQPWMLQRVKWQQSIVNESNIISDKLKIEPDELKVTGWIKKWNNDSDDNIVNMNDDDLRNQLGSSTLDDFLLENTSEIVQFGAACKTSGEIKCILRCYDEGGMLKGIILQQGKLITEEGKNP